MTPDEIITSLVLQGYTLTLYDGRPNLPDGLPHYRIKQNTDPNEAMLMWDEDATWKVKESASLANYSEVPWSQLTDEVKGQLWEDHYTKLLAGVLDRDA